MKKISFQGIAGSYSEIAALKFFGKKNIFLPQHSFEDVILSVKKEKSNYGILPIENSIHGSVLETFDLLRNYKIIINSEVNLQINHCLLCKKKINPEKLKVVYSHWQAIGQCSKYLDHLRNVEVCPYHDTAASAAFVANNQDDSAAAIASTRAAEIYDLKIIARNIQNNTNNITRFVVVGGCSSRKPNGKYKTSIAFKLKGQPGSLFKVLKVFAEYKIDLLKIESRPIPSKLFSYIFYLDFSGSISSPIISNSLKIISALTSDYIFLGSYPVGKTFKT